jgi:phosphoribosylformylglycinamidine synthase subunit PurS
MSASAAKAWPTGPGWGGSGVARYQALVEVQLRPGISDPQGATIERALPALGFSGVSAMRAGKAFRFLVEAADEVGARQVVEEMCARLLANPVIESSAISLFALAPA